MTEVIRDGAVRVGVDLAKRRPPARSPAALRMALPDALEDASNERGSLARLTLQRAVQQP